MRYHYFKKSSEKLSVAGGTRWSRDSTAVLAGLSFLLRDYNFQFLSSDIYCDVYNAKKNNNLPDVT